MINTQSGTLLYIYILLGAGNSRLVQHLALLTAPQHNQQKDTTQNFQECFIWSAMYSSYMASMETSGTPFSAPCIGRRSCRSLQGRRQTSVSPVMYIRRNKGGGTGQDRGRKKICAMRGDGQTGTLQPQNIYVITMLK